MRHAPPNPATSEQALAQRLQQLETRIQQLENTANAGYPWIAMPFNAGWEDYGAASFHAGGYSKDRTGWVRLKGLLTPNVATVAAGANTEIATLPEAYWPGRDCVFVCLFTASIARVDVRAGGEIRYEQGPSVNKGDYLSLDHIGFQAKAI